MPRFVLYSCLCCSLELGIAFSFSQPVGEKAWKQNRAVMTRSSMSFEELIANSALLLPGGSHHFPFQLLTLKKY